MLNASNTLNLEFVLTIFCVAIVVGMIEMFVIRFKNRKYKKY